MELGDASELVTDLTQSRHQHSHTRQSVARASAGTLRKDLQQSSFWSEWALACGIHPGRLTQADYLHEVTTGAWQDRSRVRTSSVAGAIQSVKFVSRKAQSQPLLAILDAPMIARYLAAAAIPQPRREALPLPFAVLVQWERWICSESAPEHEIPFIGSILGLGRPSLRRRAAHVSLVIASSQTRPSERVLANYSLQIWPPARCPCVWFLCELQARTWSLTFSSHSSSTTTHGQWRSRPPMCFSTATTFFRRA